MPTGDDDPAIGRGSPLVRTAVLRQLEDRLRMGPGVTYTRVTPGRIVPETIVASIDPPAFLGAAYPAPVATLEVWWSPRTDGPDRFSIEWAEAPDGEADVDGIGDEAGTVSDSTLPEGYTLRCGWYRDGNATDGEAYFEEVYPDGHTERYGMALGSSTPRWLLSECLRELPDRLAAFRARLGDRTGQP